MTYPARPTVQTPTSVRVLGIMNLVFAGLGLVGSLFTYAMYWGGMRLSGRNPVVEIARANPKYMTYLEVSLILGALGSIVLLVTGIGLLRLRAWARKLAIGYALYAIVAAIVGTVMTWTMVLSPMMDASSTSSEVERAGAMGGAFGGMVGAVLGVAYPVVLLLFMMRKNVVAAFERAAQPQVPPARVVR